MAFSTGEGRIKIGPPFYHVPYLIALGAIKKDAQIKVFIGQSQVDAISIFRIGIADKGPVVVIDLSIAVDVCITEPPDAFVSLVDSCRVAERLLGFCIRRSYGGGIIPEPGYFITIECSYRVAYLVFYE